MNFELVIMLPRKNNWFVIYDKDFVEEISIMGESVHPAFTESPNDMAIGSIIKCQILHVTSDMVVVSFSAQDNRTFQGALLYTQR